MVLTLVSNVTADVTHLNLGVPIVVTHPLLAEVVVLLLVLLLSEPTILTGASIRVLGLIEVRIGCSLIPAMTRRTPLDIAASRALILAFALGVVQRFISVIGVIVSILLRNLSVVLGLHTVALIHPLGIVAVAAVLLILVL